MQTQDSHQAVQAALDKLNEMSPKSTGGIWLEDLVVNVGPHIRDWDVSVCYRWGDWPDREKRFPGVNQGDIGIDVVAVRRGDGKLIAIQCKARQLDEQGAGASVSKDEMAKFISASAHSIWAERWLVTNGSVPQSSPLKSLLNIQEKHTPWINIANALELQKPPPVDEPCPHCEPNPDGEFRQQTKNCIAAGSGRKHGSHPKRA